VVDRVEHVMGMPVRAIVRDAAFPAAGHARAAPAAGVADPPIRAALDDVFAWLRWVDATFSPFDPRSAISRWGRGALALRDAHPLVRDVLDRCERLRRETAGAFDIRFRRGAPPDPCGFVKGWAIERAGAMLAAAGARDFCLDAGGDVLVRGGPWRVGIRHPRRRDRLAGVLELRDGAVATSGAYERGEHVLDPRTGRAPAGVLSVTVVGPELGIADAYATAAFALGGDGPAWTAGRDGHDAMTIVPGARLPADPHAGRGATGDRVLMTPGFARHVAGASLAASLDHRPRTARSEREPLGDDLPPRHARAGEAGARGVGHRRRPADVDVADRDVRHQPEQLLR
jgi:FAD:protein FMN transferase